MDNKDLQKIYSVEAAAYWNNEYKKNGYKVVHDAGSEEKTETLARREIDLFLWPTKKKVKSLYLDKENNPYPTFNLDFANIHKNINEYLETLNDKVALDYGCGILGRYTFSLAEHFKHVYGIDVSSVAIDGARKKIKDKNSKNTSFLMNDGQKIPLPSNFVDFIFSNLVLQHIGYKYGNNVLIKEFARCLKLDGIMRVEYYAEDEKEVKKANDFFSVVEGLPYQEEEITKVFNDNGIEILSMSNKHPYMWITAKKVRNT